MKTTRTLYHLSSHFWRPPNTQLCFVTFVLLSAIVTWVEYDYETVVMVELTLLFTPQYYFCAHIVFILLSNRRYSAFLNLHHCRTLLLLSIVSTFYQIFNLVDLIYVSIAQSKFIENRQLLYSFVFLNVTKYQVYLFKVYLFICLFIVCLIQCSIQNKLQATITKIRQIKELFHNFKVCESLTIESVVCLWSYLQV